MEIYRGKGIAPGIAIAEVEIINSEKPAKRERAVGGCSELECYNAAMAAALSEFKRLSELAAERVGDKNAELFDTYCVMAEDEDFDGAIRHYISDGMSAYDAVEKCEYELSEILRSSSDEYMRERARDVSAVAAALKRALVGGADEISLASPAIICARELTPSETVMLDRRFVRGFVTLDGGATSHTAILARAMGIPAVIGISDFPNADKRSECIIDGDEGILIVSPDSNTLERYREKLKEKASLSQKYEKIKKSRVTFGGKEISIYANISDASECADALEYGADGIGLYRSEFLFMKYGREPSEEEQFRAYSEVARAINGSEVIVRTLDIGADKQIADLGIPDEPNPALGQRAIRLCLARREMFSRQIRAILRASAYGNVSLMLPMITCAEEISEARKIIAEETEKLGNANIPCNPKMHVGIMIETPSAAVISDLLARTVDFISVGTNDLVQYTMACDRQNEAVASLCDGLPEAVRRLLRHIGSSAANAGIRAGICGEAAADPDLAEFFVRSGFTELSVSAPKIGEIKAQLLSLSRDAFLQFSGTHSV